jgi:hypothetical protein
MKFCCDKFERDFRLSNQGSPNVRIVKIDIAKVPEIDPSYPYRYYLTIGYSKGEKNVPRRSIEYCPYCGERLSERYRSDEFVNEIDHTFLSF